jgi:acetyl-CoA carboxylase biotin carboxyl carrier protein
MNRRGDDTTGGWADDEPEPALLALDRILGACVERPQRIRVRTADFAIDLDWSAQAGAATPLAATEPVNLVEPVGETVPAERNTRRHHVLAPSIGSFYRAPDPGSTPFVAEGQRVERGQQVAIIEIMKLMLAVESDVAGTVVELLKSDGEPVEYGEPVLVLELDEAA